MTNTTRQLGYFLSGQYFADGLRITLSILVPALLFARFGQLDWGIVVSLGAMNASISDAPGPVMHRRNAMLASIALSTFVTLLTGLIRTYPYWVGIEIFILSFLLSLFAVYGTRAGAVGTASLLMMILTMARPLTTWQVVQQAGLVMAGGLWYAGLSLLVSRLQPYRLAQQALGECIHETAQFLQLKARFYRTATSLEDDYRLLMSQQVQVSEKQDVVREILFKSRRIVAETTRTGRVLTLTFVDVVDLYEQIVAMYYDYAAIRERFGHTSVLEHVAVLIDQLADRLDHIGLMVQSPIQTGTTAPDLLPSLTQLKQQIDDLPQAQGQTLVLRKILVTLRNLYQRLQSIEANLQTPTRLAAPSANMEYGRFVSHQEITFGHLRANLTFGSAIFRHSLRVALAMLAGYLFTHTFFKSSHSYWVLLTIAVILKPAYSLTKKRNTERIIGTFLGGLFGLLAIYFIPEQARFGIMVVLMIATYSFQRTRYALMVLFLTPYIMIALSFLGSGRFNLISERIADTLIGGLIALAAGYLLFPKWESEQLKTPLQAMLKANKQYLGLLVQLLEGKAVAMVEYKLLRKDVYVASANLSAAFDRMMSEPKRTQRHEKLMYQLVVLNHILSANSSAMLSGLLAEPATIHTTEAIRTAKRSLTALQEALNRFDDGQAYTSEATASAAPEPTSPVIDARLTDQLRFVLRISTDISRLVMKVVD